MKIAIISDVHGNYPALKSVLNEIDRRNCDMIISLGDVAGYYCMVNECIEEFRRRDIKNLMGNHDSYLLGYGKCPRSNSVNKCIDFQKGIITEDNLAYLKKSQDKYEDEIISARHGGWNDPVDEYIYDFSFDMVEGLTQKVFCSGHTHIQSILEDGNRIYFNPGSVGQPRDGDNRAAFAVVDDDNVELIRVDYDIQVIEQAMHDAGFDSYFYRNLKDGTKIGG